MNVPHGQWSELEWFAAQRGGDAHVATLGFSTGQEDYVETAVGPFVGILVSQCA